MPSRSVLLIEEVKLVGADIGVKIRLTPGSEDNIKVTTPLDIPLAESIAAKMEGEV